MQRHVLFIVFLLSGFTGLIYESLWTHYLKLHLGHAAYAQSLVLCIFMGGMALGAWVVSRLSRRLPNLLAAYALAEAAIGVYALLFHTIFGAIDRWAFGQAVPALSDPSHVAALQWGLAALLLLPPSVVLGATFPLMSAAVIRRFPGADGRHLATLYFTNSIGAAAGVLAASFVLISWLGLPGTLTLGGLLNLLVAAVAGAIARQPEPAPRAEASAPAERLSGVDSGADAVLPRWFLLAAFVTGAASFIYEVSWIRMLSLVLGSSFHAFELMLSAFITGLALGSLAIRRFIDRVADPLRLAAWVQILMGLLAALTLLVYTQSFDWMAALVRALPKGDAGWLGFNLASHGIAFAVMLPATMLAGMTLPLFTHVMLRAGHGERAIGRIYASNSVGAIVGVLLAVHIGLPHLGLKLTLVLGALMDLLLGLALLRACVAAPAHWAAALAALAVPVLLVRTVSLDPAMLGSGVYRTGQARLEESKTLFYRDGKTASIALMLFDQRTAVLSTNGKPEAALEVRPGQPAMEDEITMILAGALPLSMRPEARSAANIGLGSGLTTHALLASPALREVATIEIEQAMVDASRLLHSRVGRTFDDPRSTIHIEDAKSWFARQHKRYDIIVSEPSNPWVSGVASLFTDELYHRIRDYMADDGLFVQWLQIYEFDLDLAASIVKAMDRNFADYAVYDIDGGNLMFVATKQGKVPLPGDAVFRMPLLRDDLAQVSVRSVDDLHFRYLGGRDDLGAMLRAMQAPVNSDFAPYVEQRAPRSRFMGRFAKELREVADADLPVVEMLAGPARGWTAQALAPRSTPRLDYVAIARQIHGQLLGTPAPTPGIRDGVTQALGRLGDCAALERRANLDELHSLATATLAYLDAPSLQPLWVQPAWLACPRAKWPAGMSQRMALYEAVARRDAPAMLAASNVALAQPGADQAWGRFAVTTGLLALRAQGQTQALGAWWQAHGAARIPAGQRGGEIQLLLAGAVAP